jgi:hypothetical protein
LRVLCTDYADMRPHSGADAELADEQLALTARDLTRATEALPYDKQPVGWDKETTG